MPQVDYRCELPYPVVRVFDLVADVERYPEFLPGWRAARIVERQDNLLTVEQTLGGPGYVWQFRTHAILDRPASIRIQTNEHPFRSLSELWRFHALDKSRTRITLHVDYSLDEFPLRGLLHTVLEQALEETMNAFSRRASELLD